MAKGLVVGHEAPNTVTSVSVVAIQLGIALGAALGGLTVDILGVVFVPLIAAVFAAGSVVLRMGLGRFLRHHPHQVPVRCVRS